MKKSLLLSALLVLSMPAMADKLENTVKRAVPSSVRSCNN